MLAQCIAACVCVAMTNAAHAQMAATGGSNKSLLSQVRFEQRLDAQLPLDARFRDHQGNERLFGEWFGRRPVVLALVYYRCPMLCNQVINGLVTALRGIDLAPGQDFDVILVSIDPREQPELARQKRASTLSHYDRADSEQGWHFLTGSEESIAAVAASIGYEFRYDPKSRQYAHASGVIVVTPNGRTARYFYGIEYPTRDLRWSLIEASQGHIGSAVDQVLLFCFHFDPTTGRYGLAILRLLRLSAALTVLALAGYILRAWRRESHAGVKL